MQRIVHAESFHLGQKVAQGYSQFVAPNFLMQFALALPVIRLVSQCPRHGNELAPSGRTVDGSSGFPIERSPDSGTLSMLKRNDESVPGLKQLLVPVVA